MDIFQKYQTRKKDIHSLPRMYVFGFDPIGGHGAMYLFDLAFYKALAEQNVKVIWATCDETQATVDGYELWTPFRNIYGKESMWRRGIRYAQGLWALFQRVRQIGRQQPVVVHQQFVTIPFLELLFVLSIQRLGVPCVLSPHDVVPYVDVSKSRWLLPRLYRQYDALIVHSKIAEEELREMLGENSPPIYLLPHGHYNDSHGDGPYIEKSKARLYFGLLAAQPTILFLGQVKKEKGLEYLIRAMPAVLEHVPNALLLIAGRPLHNDITIYETLIDELNIRASVRTRWEYIPDEELPLYYRATDVVALPYTRVYQSGVCLTAYAFRRPVVASAVGGLKEQVLDGETGYLVPPSDPTAIANALVKSLRQPDLAEAMGERGHTWAGEKFDWGIIAARTVEVYQEVWTKRH